ncbi:MAG: 3-dehydroquinate synthase [Aquabacterium sp.]
MHSSPATRVPIALEARSYDILIRRGLLDTAEGFDGLPTPAVAVVVTNDVVGPLHAPRLELALRRRHAQVLTVELPDGEAHKDWPSLNRIFDAMLTAGCDRNTMVYALGGGVVGDMAGFAAACYMRGVPFVQIPTTLLAQVDSSVGGKTAINHPLAKNMIGAFYQPLRVLCDLDLLQTLPAREYRSGLAEVIKYGLVSDPAFLVWIEEHVDELLARDDAALTHAVRRSCEIKAEVVGQDERESGLRAILNFGHTFGHAIEAGLGYGAWLHGEAVACGMVMAADLSARLGLVEGGFVGRLSALLQRCGLPVVGPDLGRDRWLALMRMDKKAQAGAIRFVVLDGLGQARMTAADDDLVADVIAAHVASA